MDEAIGVVSSITGASPAIARHFLSITDGDTQQAIQLFFDSPDLSSSMDTGPPAQSRDPNTSRREPADVIDLDSGSDEEMKIDTDTVLDNELGGPEESSTEATRAVPSAALGSLEDDEAVARRMQEELYASGDMTDDYDLQGVRAPMARTTETLVGPGADWTANDMHEAVLQQMRARRQSRSSMHFTQSNLDNNMGVYTDDKAGQGRPGVFNQQGGPSSIWDESNPTTRREGLATATGGASEASSKAAKLAELFRPPFELMTRMPWDDARQQGKDKSKWILVNIQDPSIFDCQSLNRDIWKHEGIKETIKENFIFMQYDKDDPRGNQYIQYYFPLRDSDAAYPHIAIVDPRTGEQVKVWSGPPVPKAMDFLMQLHEFLDRYSLNVSVKNPVAKRKPEKMASVDVDKLTEEQMLDLALQNSLVNGDVTGPKEHDPDDLTKSIGDLGTGKGKETEADYTNVDMDIASKPSPKDDHLASTFSNISNTSSHTEPAHEPMSTTRIQFRHSTGRIIRRFNVSDPVRRIYEWLKADPIQGKTGIDFELKSMGKDLIDLLDESISGAGLKNGTVMVEYLED